MKVLCIGGQPTFIGWVDSTMRQVFPDLVTLAAHTSAEGLSLLSAHGPEVVILEPESLEVPMTSVVKEIRDFSTVPLIVMSYEWGDQSAVAALESGADDYVRMPCDPAELAVRIMALLRRSCIPERFQDLFISEGTSVLEPLD